MKFPWISTALARLPGTPSAMPNAVLLNGQPGLGKRATALFLAKAILCEAERDAFGACGSCPSCHLYAAGNHPDLRVIEVGQEEEELAGSDEEASSPVKKASRQIPVSAIRGLADLVMTTAYRGRAKVIVIVPAEAMHPSAANALLKILEEPPGNCHFLLVSHQPDRIPPTIRSRCFQVTFALPTLDAALDWLKGQGVEQAELALAQGGYAPFAAMEMAKDTEFWSQRKALLDLLARPAFDPLVAADRAEPIDGPIVAMLLSRWAYDLILLKSGGIARYHVDYHTALEQLARNIPTDAVMGWYDSVLQYAKVAQHPLNKRLAMESLFSGYPGH